MLYKAKTKDGTWVSGFLVGIFKDAERETIDSFSINEGFEGVDAVKVDERTVCAFVCLDKQGNNAYVNDYIELRQDSKYVQCLLIKEENGFEVYPNYQDGSLWKLDISNGVGEFKVIGNRFDDNDKLKDWLDSKDLWFKRRINSKK